MGQRQKVEISEGARLADALRDAIGDTEYGDERERKPAIERATRAYVIYLCGVISRVMQRWANRRVTFWDDYEDWTDHIADGVVRCVVSEGFSIGDSLKHIDAVGQFDIAGAIIDDVWAAAIESWRIKGSEAELTALQQRILHVMWG
jgi:hypothetical protein